MHQTDLNTIPDEGYELRQIEENELKTKLYAAIDQLPEQCRKVFEMSRFEELKQQEIADKLGISIKTVKNHITIALKQLSKLSVTSLLLLFLILKNLFHF
jgi:RNA polymerase sigma-70 factor (ECF subfamily)